MVDVMAKVRENLIGQVFDRLMVIERAEDYIGPSGRHYSRWLCECNCEDHNRVLVLGQSLKSRRTKSCGCLHKEIATELGRKSKKMNEYRFYSNVVYGKCFNEDIEFCFSLDDFDMLSRFCWVLDKSNGYLVARDADINKKVYMHQLICKTNKQVDHINRNRLDNRRENLRPATQQENRFNNSIRSDNTSGIIGVCWHKQAMKWTAQIQVGNTNINLGTYNNFNDAIIARLKAELKYFGSEFAPQRHLFTEYGIQND